MWWVPQSILSDHRKKIGVETVLAIITPSRHQSVEQIFDTNAICGGGEETWIKHSVHVLIHVCARIACQGSSKFALI